MKKNVLKRIIKTIKPYRVYVVLSTITALISVAMLLYIPVLIGNGVDLIVGKDNVNFDGLVMILVKIAGAACISSLFQWIMSQCVNKIAYGTVNDIREQAFEKLLYSPLSYIDAQSQGDLIARIVTDTEIISDGLVQCFNQLFTGLMTIIGTLAFMISINLSIALIVVFLTPVSLFVASIIAKKSYNMFAKQSETRGRMTGLIEEAITNQNIVEAFDYQSRSQQQFSDINDELYDCGVRAQFYSSITNPSTRFVNGLVYTGVGVFGALAVIGGNFSVGALSCFLTYANQYTKPFNEISGVITELQNAFSSAKRVFDIIDIEPEQSDDNNKVLKTSDGNIEINNVSFSYSKDKELIKNFNLDVKTGERVAIVGPTGCGKTTFINLLMRFYDVDDGAIKIDGINIKDVTRKSLRGMYGMVLQETWLKSGTIRDNIAYGKPDATDEEVIEAAKKSHCHHFIKRLPDGYDTVVSDSGDSISQGQKQLLCIARIMLMLPPLLILDEATSSIDTRTEIKIQNAFTTMMKGRTSFIVAHRLSTIREADIILVMDKGRIIESGNHESLLMKKGFYYNLYNSQFAKE